MPCKEYRLTASAKHDGELSHGQEAALIKHLKECKECLDFNDFLAVSSAVLSGAAGDERPPEYAWTNIKTAVSLSKRKTALKRFALWFGAAAAGICIITGSFSVWKPAVLNVYPDPASEIRILEETLDSIDDGFVLAENENEDIFQSEITDTGYESLTV